MAPPAPPWRVLMRRSASREQLSVPKTLMANMRWTRAALISSTRAATSTTPALLTSPESAPASRSSAWNIATTWASSATSACSTQARRPAARTCRGHGVGRGLVARVVDGDVPAARGGEAGGGGADAAAAAGDEEDGVHPPMLGRRAVG